MEGRNVVIGRGRTQEDDNEINLSIDRDKAEICRRDSGVTDK